MSSCHSCSSCTLSCVQGYVGHPEAVCMGTSWEYFGTCQLGSCGDVTQQMVHLHASLASSCGDSPGTTCPLHCDPGYVGAPVAMCDWSLHWTVEGSCVPLSCGPLDHPSLLWMNTSGCQLSAFGTTCDLRCLNGYVGTPTSQCAAEGLWRNAGRCLPVDCGPADHPSGDTVDLSGCLTTTFGASCVLSCMDGIPGDPGGTCNADGLWQYSGACPNSSDTRCSNVDHPDPQVRM